MTTGSVRQSSCDPEREEKRMFARVASVEGGDVERLRRLNEERVNDGTMELPEGLKSTMMLQEHEGDVCSSFFDSREAVVAAQQRFGRWGRDPRGHSRARRTSLDVDDVVWQRDA